MDRRLLRYYERELRHIRETAGEFADEYPKIAGRLGLDRLECADPYVERLLEGFAFLTARVHLKLDAEFPRLTQSLLEAVYPHYLAPTPSMAVVRFQPDEDDPGLAGGMPVPRRTPLRSTLGKGELTACEYRTAHEIHLFPLRIAEASYHIRDVGALELPAGVHARAALRLRLRSTAGLSVNELSLDRLPIHLAGADETPMRIYEQLMAHASGMVVRPVGGASQIRLGKDAVRRLGFEDDEALLPHGPRSFQGYRLLQEYFAFPRRFLFAEFAGLGDAVGRCEGEELELIVPFNEQDVELEGGVTAANFALFCTPAINIFPKRCDRIHVSDRAWEFHVVPDRTKPLDYEVYRIDHVEGFGGQAADRTEFRPLFAASDFERAGGEAYHAVSRVPRTLSAKEQRSGRRSSYTGSEVYVSIVDSSSAPYHPDLKQLGVESLCTNRDLPLRMPVGVGRTDFTTELGPAVASVRCVAGPTAPRPSFAEGETAWRLISHLTLNYLSLVDSDEQEGAASLRELLKLYGDAADPSIGKQVEGLRSVRTSPITRRVRAAGPVAFARGLEVTLTLDENAFEGTGVFLLGAVLERFFARYVSINSFTETVVRSTERGQVMRWPARTGGRPLI